MSKDKLWGGRFAQPLVKFAQLRHRRAGEDLVVVERPLDPAGLAVGRDVRADQRLDLRLDPAVQDGELRDPREEHRARLRLRGPVVDGELAENLGAGERQRQPREKNRRPGERDPRRAAAIPEERREDENRNQAHEWNPPWIDEAQPLPAIMP